MPVPEIQVPDATPEAMPVPQSSAPPLGAFSGADVGGALSKIGDELFGEGWNEYHKAIEAVAQDKENQFQSKALALRDQYRNLGNMDAITAHSKFTDALENLRQEVGQSIGSKYGSTLYNSNSLRNSRLVQESIDSHFEQQNRSYQDMVYKDGNGLDTTALASLAADPKFDPAKVQLKTDMIMERTKNYEMAHGVPAEQAEEHAKKQLGVSLDAYFDVLTNKDSGRSTSEIKSEYDKWNSQGLLDKHVQVKVMASGQALEARAAVRDIVEGTKRLVNDAKFDGHPDPDGEPDFTSIDRKVFDYIQKHPEQEEYALREQNALHQKLDNEFTQTVKSKVDRVVADARRTADSTGVFKADPTSRDYLWLLRNKATALDSIVRSEYTSDQRVQKVAHDANASHFKSDLITMAANDPTAFNKLDPAQIFKMQDDPKYAGGFDKDFRLGGADKILKELQDQHQKGELAWVQKTTSEYLARNIYTNKSNSDEVLKTKAGPMYTEISTALQEALKNGSVKRDNFASIDAFLKAETSKVDQKTIFGAKVFGSYKAEQDAKIRATLSTPQAAPAPAPAPKASPTVVGPHKIVTIKRAGQPDRQWDQTDSKWVP